MNQMSADKHAPLCQCGTPFIRTRRRYVRPAPRPIGVPCAGGWRPLNPAGERGLVVVVQPCQATASSRQPWVPTSSCTSPASTRPAGAARWPARRAPGSWRSAASRPKRWRCWKQIRRDPPSPGRIPPPGPTNQRAMAWRSEGGAVGSAIAARRLGEQPGEVVVQAAVVPLGRDQLRVAEPALGRIGRQPQVIASTMLTPKNSWIAVLSTMSASHSSRA